MGNIGLRYLQSILNTDESYEVICYDISKNFQDRTISFLSNNNLPNKKIHFSPSLELLEDNTYLKTAFNQIQEKIDAMDDDLGEKFLNYPIPKQIIEEYNKVFN